MEKTERIERRKAGVDCLVGRIECFFLISESATTGTL